MPDATDNVDQMEDDFVKIPKSEYEAFKDRLVSIEAKISHEFNMTKLDAVKAEMDQNNSLLLNGPEKVENKFNKTLHEVEKLEESERRTEQLARRLSRDLKIRPSFDHAIMRSPSARKIGSLRRRRDSSSRLSRNQSWHLGQTSPGPLKKPQEDPSKFISSSSFYPKSNLKRAKPVQAITHQTSRPLPALPPSTEKVSEKQEKIVPEKPLRVKRESIDHFVTPMKVVVKAHEVWTPATDFFDNGTSMEVDTQQRSEDMFFKTPNRPIRMSSSRSAAKADSEFTKTPMLPPRFTPSSKTPMRGMEFSAVNKSLMLTPSMHNTSQGRESIIILRNQNAGMVAQKAKLFNGLSDVYVPPVQIPRVIVNKNLENVRKMSFDDTPNKKRQNVASSSRSPRRSSRSPGIQKRNNFKATAPSQSPLLKTIRESSESQKAKLLSTEIINEIASPKSKHDHRKPLSQSNTPRRTSKTPNRDSAKKQRRQTPSKSPRFVRRLQTSD